jgi:hypothetical protein
MSQLNILKAILKTSRLFAAAGVISATGLFAMPPTAQSDPPAPCTQWGFDGLFKIHGANGWTVTFTSTGTIASGDALVRFDDGGTVDGNVLYGGIAGRRVDVGIQWMDKADNVWGFVGDVSSDGRVYNGREDSSRPFGYTGPTSSAWDSQTHLKCMDAPPPPPAQLTGVATVVSDVEVHEVPALSSPVIQILRGGDSVQLVGDSCKPDDWCHVDVAGVKGWAWGHLKF